MLIVFATIGVGFCIWWVIGLVLFSYSNVLILGPAPWSVRIKSAAIAGVLYPWILMTRNAIPSCVIAPDELTPEQETQLADFKRRTCPCPSCRARRGE